MSRDQTISPEIQALREEFNSGIRILHSEIRRLQEMLEQSSSLKEYHSVREFADLVGMSTSSVREWCEKGLIKAVQADAGKKWQIARSEVQRFREQAKSNHYNSFKRNVR